MKSNLSQRRLRMPSAVLGVALLSGAFLATAAPASAVVVDELHDVTGTVSLLDAVGGSSTAAGLELTIYPPEYSPWTETTDADGEFTFADLEDGDYALEVVNPDSDDYGMEYVEFTVAGGDVVLDPIVLMTYLDEGTMSVSGDSVVGETLTITTGGWPSGVTLSYQWGFSTGQSGGPIDGATAATLTLTKEQIGYMISAFVTAEKTGFAPTTIALFSDEVVSTPKKPAAPAPVTDSDDLASYLAGKGSTPEAQESIGLPAGFLSPSKGYQAELSWFSPDSYVDVYLYSTPVFVGTFPVVDGVVQIDLSADVLSELGAGGHTLVVLGQSSGVVSSVKISLAATLASTGVDPALAFSASGLFLILGAAALFAARRMRSKA
jgi:LPXTG-motif cell wall-anchored protein